MKFKTIEWKGDWVRILDQRKLPQEVRYLDCRDASSVAQAIRTMAIRGAPAIGVAAAMGIALAAKKARFSNPRTFTRATEKVCQQMRETRPTAVNLFWAVDRMKKILDQVPVRGVEETKERLVKEAIQILEEDIEVNHKNRDVWEETYKKWRWSAYPLQCRGIGNGWIWNSTGSDLCGMG